MRIGLFTDSYFPSINGVSVSVHQLYQELTTLGHEVFIFTNVHDDAVDHPHVIRFKAIRPPKKALREYRVGLFSYFKIKRVRTYDLDIIHCHSEITMGRIARKVAKLDHIPFVYTYHTMYEHYTHFISKRGAGALRKFFKWVSLFYADFAEAVIFPTEKVAQTFLGYGFKKPYHIIPTGIDLSAFNASPKPPAMSARLEALKKPFPHCLFVGRLSHEKSIQSLLESVKILRQKSIRVYVTLIGDGPDKATYETYVNTHNLSDQVEFTGMIAHEVIPFYYQTADFFVNFSQTESQGLTYIEALASGLPVLARWDVHLDTWIIPQVNGILFDSNEAFIALMQDIVAHPESYQMDKAAIRQSVRAFDKKIYAERVETLYHSLIKKSSKT